MKTAGVTLLELLLCVAVIALLMAIVVPAVGRARDRANLVLCQGHLRNIGAGVLLYAHANDGFLPVVAKLDNPHTELMATLGKGDYVADPRMYYCPSMCDPGLVFSEANVAAGAIGYFYFSCRQATANPDVSTFLRWGPDVTWPRVLRDGMDPATWVISDIWLSGQSTSHRYYKKGINYSTLGGETRMVWDSPRQEFK